MQMLHPTLWTWSIRKQSVSSVLVRFNSETSTNIWITFPQDHCNSLSNINNHSSCRSSSNNINSKSDIAPRRVRSFSLPSSSPCGLRILSIAPAATTIYNGSSDGGNNLIVSSCYLVSKKRDFAITPPTTFPSSRCNHPHHHSSRHLYCMHTDSNRNRFFSSRNNKWQHCCCNRKKWDKHLKRSSLPCNKSTSKCSWKLDKIPLLFSCSGGGSGGGGGGGYSYDDNNKRTRSVTDCATSHGWANWEEYVNIWWWRNPINLSKTIHRTIWGKEATEILKKI